MIIVALEKWIISYQKLTYTVVLNLFKTMKQEKY